jgi:hypothetical protein
VSAVHEAAAGAAVQPKAKTAPANTPRARSPKDEEHRMLSALPSSRAPQPRTSVQRIDANKRVKPRMAMHY